MRRVCMGVAMASLVFGVVFAAAPPTAAADRGGSMWTTGKPAAHAKNPKADWRISAVAGAAASLGDAEALRQGEALGLKAKNGRLRVIVEVSDVAGAGNEISQAGVEVERSAGNLIQVLAAPGQLKRLTEGAAVRYVRPPLTAKAEAVTDEGVASSNASVWQQRGQSGAGVKVAVIDLGFTGYTSAIASGDLPSDLTAVDDCGGAFTTYTNHGTAVAEIVHKMAPGAQLYLICIDTEVDLAAAEAYAAASGVTIVNHSVGWYNAGRGDGTSEPGMPDATVAQAQADGILWVNAAGNEAQTHWSGSFVDDGHGWEMFAPGDVWLNQFYLPSGAGTCVYLKWDNWPYSSQDFDLYVYQMSTGAYIQSEDTQDGSQAPTEWLCFMNAGSGQYFGVGIYKYRATATPRFDLFVTDVASIQYPVAAGSVTEPASSPYAFAVGAVCWQGTTIEAYSSRGPTIDNRVKPDISGQDKVSTRTYGASGTCSSNAGFPGTSAASPHVAGAAALVKGAHPEYTPAQIQSYLANSATDLGSVGNDNTYGYGLLHMPTIGFVPSAPTGASAAGRDSQATVTWTAPAFDGGASITGYTVTASPGPGTCVWTTGPLSCTVAGLTNYVNYTFTVSATNSVGTGPASAASNPVVPGPWPNPPTGVTATAGNGQATVSWTAPVDNGNPIIQYTVLSAPGAKTCSWTSGPLSCSVTGLTNGNPYTFTVTATNLTATGPASDPSNLVTPAGPPTAPKAVAAVAGNHQVTVSWTAPDSNGGSAITGYTVAASPGPATCLWTAGPLTCTVTGLTNNITYTFTVTATNAAGIGPASTASAGVKPSGVSRYGGTDRFQVAANAAIGTYAKLGQNGQPTGEACGCVVYIANYLAWPDALAAGTAAGKLPGPILFVTGALPLNPSTVNAINILKPDQIIVMGGPASVPDAVKNALQTLTGKTPRRYGGADRFEVAKLAAIGTYGKGVDAQGHAIPCGCVVYIAHYLAWPDALAAGTAAGKLPGPVLFVTGALPLNPRTVEAINALKPDQVIVMGGPASVPDAVKNAVGTLAGKTPHRYGGTDRFAVAEAAALGTYGKVDSGGHPVPCGCVVYIANYLAWPDALVAGTTSGKFPGPVLFVTTTGIDARTIEALNALLPHQIVVLGGPASVPETVYQSLASYLH